MSLIQTPMSKKGGCDVSDIKTVTLISGPSLLGQHLISGLSSVSDFRGILISAVSDFKEVS